MTVCDTGDNLSALRKLYRRLEKIVAGAGESPEPGSGALPLILFCEAARRLAEHRGGRDLPRQAAAAGGPRRSAALQAEPPEKAGEFLLKFGVLQQELRRALPPSIFAAFLPRELEEICSAMIADLFSELQKHAQLLDSFDERFAGYFFQFSCEDSRKQALSRIQCADKRSSKQDIISFTQLYTPDWAADYLLANTILPQWNGELGKISDPADSRSAGAGQILKPAAPHLKPDHPNSNSSSTSSSTAQALRPAACPAASLTVLDPACGAGHILLRAFDLFLQMKSVEGHEPAAAAGSILRHNLYGCDLDRQALWVCGFSLILKALICGAENLDFELNLADASSADPQGSGADPGRGTDLEPACCDKTLEVAGSNADLAGIETGSLGRRFAAGHPLLSKYSAVVTNPPYIGRRLMDRRLKQFLKDNYPSAEHDISAAFLLRALELSSAGGKVGFITQSSLLYLPSYGELRRAFIENDAVESVVELGTRVFPLNSGEKINSMLIVLRKRESLPRQNRQEPGPEIELPRACRAAAFLDLSNSADKAGELFVARRIVRDCREFLLNRENSFNYKYPPVLCEIVQRSKTLSDYAEVKQGLATGDNGRFVRFWWDVESCEIGKRWRPYVKGAGSRRWHAPCRTVLDWGDDGRKIKDAVEETYPYLNGRVAWVVKNEQYYFRRGLTFSFVSTGALAVRRLQEGSIFDVGGSSLFCNDSHEDFLLAYLNSSFAAVCAELLNPTFNFQVGDIKQIPLPDFSPDCKAKLADLAAEAYALKSCLGNYDETEFEFEYPDLRILPGAERTVSAVSLPRFWRSLENETRRGASRLLEIEAEIDRLIFRWLSGTYTFSAEQESSLLNLLQEKERSRKIAEIPLADSAAFAEFFIRRHIQLSLAESPLLVVELEIPFREQINDDSRLWLEEQLGSCLSDYLRKRFNRSQEKLYQGSPRLTSCLHGESGKLAFLDSRNLRKYMKAPDRSKLSLDAAGLAIIDKIAENLKTVPDWTGKDLRCVAEAENRKLGSASKT